MTIEVRQILIRSIVGETAAPGGPGADAPQGVPPPGTEWVERLRQELLAQCRDLLEAERRRAQER